jgi:hypothetical protein
MEKVKLLDDTTYPVDRCGTMNDQLLIRVTEGSILSLVPEFGDPEKTAVIEHYFEGTETDHVFFNGYTALTAMSQDQNGVLIYLKRGD